MDVKEFDYHLPEELIAQFPLERRDASRLMVLDRLTGAVRHAAFSDITGLLRKGDSLVLNDTRVMPARLLGHKGSGGRVELLLVRETRPGVWECMIRNSKGLKSGSRVFFDGGGSARAVEISEGICKCEFGSAQTPWELMERSGSVPLPPYIRRDATEEDRARYQTVYAAEGKAGAVAAPTAGLHFTGELLGRIRALGVEICSLTLHTGPGTFLPVRSEKVEGHRMHAESYSIPEAAFETVIRAKADGRRVIAVGTTAARALEAAAKDGLSNPALDGTTDIFIYPGFVFKVIDGLLTNFHLPCSTLLMLVCAFAGRDRALAAYREAVDKRYRFFSYGDAMFIA
ncbi:MAG: tRNA preQ1(34) S-adenosylmethionine ribosyltransferase-isomerase QueA [Deltaproteobacteria bacterium]|nr:tRNA preQ1(34) S-adenosylmethionine ribosyltransferase-isomerase QueA [Deltaproteobacteria bacterium]